MREMGPAYEQALRSRAPDLVAQLDAALAERETDRGQGADLAESRDRRAR
jgi:hypothetical protein